jgi:hypothetical protein
MIQSIIKAGETVFNPLEYDYDKGTVFLVCKDSRRQIQELFSLQVIGLIESP